MEKVTITIWLTINMKKSLCHLSHLYSFIDPDQVYSFTDECLYWHCEELVQHSCFAVVQILVL